MVLTRRSLSTLFLLGIFLTLLGAVQAGDFMIEVISVTSHGAFGRGSEPSLSHTARQIAFELTQQLVPADKDGFQDIYLRDRAKNQTILVSVSSAGVKGNASSYMPTITLDGGYVVFFSDASNLIFGDSPNTPDLFMRDLQNNQTTRIAPANIINNYPADITPDGRYVAFVSDADNIVAGDTNGRRDVFRYDRDTQQLALVNATSGGLPGNNHGEAPAISDDGRYVFFHSLANDLVASDTNNTTDVFRRDMLSSDIVRVSVSSASAQGDGPSTFADVSGDGRYVAFRTDASNLVSIAVVPVQVVVRDMQTGQNTLASISTDGLAGGNNGSEAPYISADGRFVAFGSSANNLVAEDSNFAPDIFLRDLQTDVTTRVNLTNAGAQATSAAGMPEISPDGTFIGFQTSASLLTGASSDTLYIATNIFLPNVDPFDAVTSPGYFDALPAKLTWNPLSWAQEYEIHIADNPAFSAADSHLVSALEYDLNGLENGVYYWQIRARDAANVWGSWSAIQTFELEVE